MIGDKPTTRLLAWAKARDPDGEAALVTYSWYRRLGPPGDTHNEAGLDESEVNLPD